MPENEQRLLERFMWLSIAAAVVTICLKVAAAWVTGSVGFLSDAIESLINLVAALVGLWALKLAAKPADANHNFGHAKAEYFSAQVEGAMILVAAIIIIVTAIGRILNPQPVEQLGIGLLFSVISTLVNLGVGLVLVSSGEKYRSSTLAADGKHLLTDVWTTVGVIVSMVLVGLTGWQVLDPIVALVVGANILFTGYRLLRSAMLGLLSEALPPDEVAKIREYLSGFEASHGVAFTSLRTAAFGRGRLINVTMQVPGEWTVSRSHKLADDIEEGLATTLGGAETIVHVEPLGRRDQPKPGTIAPVAGN